MAVVSQSVNEGVIVNEAKVCRTLKEFYPFYLSEHANRISCRLHFVGTSLEGIETAYGIRKRQLTEESRPAYQPFKAWSG